MILERTQNSPRKSTLKIRLNIKIKEEPSLLPPRKIRTVNQLFIEEIED